MSGVYIKKNIRKFINADIFRNKKELNKLVKMAEPKKPKGLDVRKFSSQHSNAMPKRQTP